MIQIFVWWLWLQILGWSALPVAFRVLRWLPDRGYTVAKPLGLLLSSYLLWLGATTGFLRNDPGGNLAAVVLVAGLGAWFYFRPPFGSRAGSPSLPKFLRRNRRLILTAEALFLVAFLAWAALRAYAPDKVMSAGGEKFMEMAFLNGILNSPTFPPLDPWLSGFAISYYYFGYVMMAMLARLSGALPGVAFDLYDALLFALTVLGAFGLVFNLVAAARGNAEARDREGADGQAVRYGLLGSLLLAVMGNLEGFLEALYFRGVLPAGFWAWLDIPGLADNPVTGSWFPGSGGGWWWWRASRVIQDYDLRGQPMGISPITEFPFFSFLLGDNHPHVLGLPFVLLALALAFNLLRRQLSAPLRPADRAEEAPLESPRGRGAQGWRLFEPPHGGDWIFFGLYALVIGSLGFLNTWDMPIYLGLMLLAYGAGVYSRRRKLDWPFLRQMLLLGAAWLAGSILLYLFFYLAFSSQAGGILPYVFPPTRLPQYLVMFGPFVFVLAWFLIFFYRFQSGPEAGRGRWKPVLRLWGWVLLAVLAVYLVVLILPPAAIALSQMTAGEPVSFAEIEALFGGLNLGAVFGAALLSRLLNPWLLLLGTSFLALAIAGMLRRTDRTPDEQAAAGACSAGSARFALILIFVGIALTLSVELFYLRDNFGARMNTVFKFYYQGWVMLACAGAFAAWWLLNPGRQALGALGRRLFSAGALALLLMGLVYPLTAAYSRVDGFRHAPDLNALSPLARQNPDDWAAIEWLRNQSNPSAEIPVILEAPGQSYNYEGRISAFTGYPALLGWSLHEGQWRGDYTEQSLREPDIAAIYTTHDGQLALELLHKWGVGYVIVGRTEQNYIQRLCSEGGRSCNLSRALAKFDTVLEPVFEAGEMTVYRVPPAPAATAQ